jgi:hypothetical protein
MDVLRFSKTIESETLHLPKLKPLIGQTVAITVEVVTPEVRDEFWPEAGRLPESEEALDAQKARFRDWRSDPRFRPYWAMLDGLLARDLATVRKWSAAAEAVRDLQDCDSDAWRQQREYDLKHANDHLS